MQYRDLEKVRTIIQEATGLEVAYAYDDLVFPDHTAFIIQYHASDDTRFIYYHHTDCIPSEEKQLFKKLQASFEKQGCSLSSKSAFQLEQKGEHVEIQFV